MLFSQQKLKLNLAVGKKTSTTFIADASDLVPAPRRSTFTFNIEPENVEFNEVLLLKWKIYALSMSKPPDATFNMMGIFL